MADFVSDSIIQSTPVPNKKRTSAVICRARLLKRPCPATGDSSRTPTTTSRVIMTGSAVEYDMWPETVNRDKKL
jgi:hypothetical protein